LYVDQRTNTSYLLPIELIVNNIDAQSSNSFLLKDSPQSYFDIKESFLKSYSMVGGSFSEEFSFFEIFERFYAFMYKSSIAQQYISLFRISYQSKIKVNKYTEEVLNLLPRNYSSKDYLDFLEMWGDVKSIDAEIGGLKELTLSYRECSPITDNEMMLEAKNEVEGIVTGTKTYLKRSERKIGGKPEFINDNEKWKQIILTNPAIVKLNRVYKWTDIIEDPLIKINFEMAYKDFEQNKADRYKNGLEENKEKI
jgi:hypothetical protein